MLIRLPGLLKNRFSTKKMIPKYMLGSLLFSATQVLAQNQILQLYQPPIETVAKATGATELMQFARAYGFDIVKTDGNLSRKIFMNWGQNADASGLASDFAHKWSSDAGITYGATVLDKPALNFGNAIKKRDGELLCLPFIPIDDSTSPKHTFHFDYYTSANDGTTWDPIHHDGTLNFGSMGVYWMRIHRGMFETDDGLFLPAYASYANNGGRTRCILLKSVDQGTTWNWYADITNPAADPASYDEVTVAICANGDWMAVFRQGQYVPIKYSRSTNKGLTWSPAALLPGLPTVSDSNDNYNESVDPFLQLMPNGIMILTYGRPNTHLAFSLDGNGTNWVWLATTFLEQPGVLGKQSTNYSCVVPVGRNKFIQFGDTGADWVYSQGPHPSPNPYSIWQKRMELVTNRQNRLDLTRKILNNWVTIMPQTTLTTTSAAHPETRTLGAVDGSTDYWSAAMGNNNGVYQLNLQKKFNLTSVGVAMLWGKQQSGTVELSPDGSNWTTIRTYNSETHYCIDYTDLSTPFVAQYVRISVSGSGQIGLGELELYETSSSFEGNAATPGTTAHGLIPPGYASYGTSASLHGMSVRDGLGFQSTRALVLYDGSDAWIAGIKKTEAASNAKTLEFRCRVSAMPAGGSFSMRILGTVAGTQKEVFFFAVFPDGSLKANEGSGFTQVIAGPGSIPIASSTWKKIKITANRSSNTASVYIDDTLRGSATMYSLPASTTDLNGFGFASNGTLTSGETIIFDDLNFYDPQTEAGSGTAATNAVAEELAVNRPPNDVQGAFSIKASPNPAQDVVNIQVSNTARGIIRLNVLNAAGMPVKSIHATCDGNRFTYNLPTGDLSAGMYVVSALQGNKTVKTKIVIMR